MPVSGAAAELFWSVMTNFVIRQALVNDIDALASLFDEYRQFYAQPSAVAAARTFLLARFQHREAVLFLASAEGQELGFMQLYPSFESIALRPMLVLNDLYVRAIGRKQGIGTGLLAAAADYARAVGAGSLQLSTAVTNTRAQALYEANGWVRDAAFYTYDLSV